MGPRTERIPDDQTLPDRVDVVIIGGGIIGVSTARALAAKGLSVAVCEKGYIAGEQSSRNWGWCRATHRDLRELELSLESLKLWRRIDAELGIDTGYRGCGILYAAADARALADHEAWLERATALVGGDALDSRIVSPEQTAALMQGSVRRFAGGIYTPTPRATAAPNRSAPCPRWPLRCANAA